MKHILLLLLVIASSYCNGQSINLDKAVTVVAMPLAGTDLTLFTVREYQTDVKINVNTVPYESLFVAIPNTNTITVPKPVVINTTVTTPIIYTHLDAISNGILTFQTDLTNTLFKP